MQSALNSSAGSLRHCEASSGFSALVWLWTFQQNMVFSLLTSVLGKGEMCGAVFSVEQGCSQALCLLTAGEHTAWPAPYCNTEIESSAQGWTKASGSAWQFIPESSQSWMGREGVRKHGEEMIHLITTFSASHHWQMGDLNTVWAGACSQTSGDCSSGLSSFPTLVKPSWNLFVLGAFTSTGGSELPSSIMYVMERHSFVFILNWLPGNFKGVPILSNLIWRMCAQWLDHRNGSLN